MTVEVEYVSAMTAFFLLIQFGPQHERGLFFLCHCSERQLFSGGTQQRFVRRKGK